MRKTTKKLLSSTLAGLFVLSSFPLMGAAEAEGNVALKFTPGIDGEKDAAYNESYTMHTDAAWGGVDFSFLYDASYIYVYADVKSSEKGIFNSFDLAFMATDAPKDNWDSIGTSCDVASNPFWEDGNAMDIRHWQNTMNGYEKLGFNLGWQAGNKPSESTVELVDVTPDSEYKLVATDDGAVVEFRIAYTGINEGAAISVSGDTNTAAWSKLWGGTDYTTFVLGDEYKAEVPDDTSDPVTDAPTDPVTDAPTDPVTDTPTEPDTDAPVDPDPETSTIDGVKDSYYNDENVLTNAAGTLYYAPVKTDGVPELHCYIEVPASAEKVLFHIMNDGDAFWQGSATLTVNVKEDTGIYAFIFGGVSEDIGSGPVMDNKTDAPINNFAVKAIDGDKVAVEFAVPSSQIVSGKEYYAAFGVDADGVIDWNTVYNSGNVAGGTGTKIVLGDLVDLNGETPVDPKPETNVIKKGTPELDGVLDGKYLKSAVYRTIDSAKAGKSEFGGWINPSQAKRQALIVAGIMSVEDSKLTVTENSNFGVSAFAKSETYFLWDDDALYIFSTVYDEDPNAYTGETASALNNGIFDYTQWIDDNIIHRIVTKSGVADLLANAGGELLADNKINNAASYENPTLTSILGYYRNENAENVRGIVESDRYTIEMRIPFLDSVKADVLKDGAEIGYGYRIIDGDSGRLTGNTETTWLSIQNNGFDSGLTATTLVLSDEVVEDPEVTTDPTPTDTVVPPDDTETDPFVSDTKEPDVSDTKEPDVSDTKEPDVSDTKEPDVSDTDEPTPDNLGDVTGDGVVNAKDLIRLMKFIAGEDVEIVGTSDINGDKNTNAKDLVALMKLIAAAE